jgi:hypothetical protein
MKIVIRVALLLSCLVLGGCYQVTYYPSGNLACVSFVGGCQ